MDEYEAIVQAQHHYCEMADYEYVDLDDSLYPEACQKLAAEFVEIAYQLGKIVDKMAAEI